MLKLSAIFEKKLMVVVMKMESNRIQSLTDKNKVEFF